MYSIRLCFFSLVQGAVYVSMPHAASGRNHSSNDASKRTSRNSPELSAGRAAMLPGVSSEAKLRL